jgi:hypothetical protein
MKSATMNFNPGTPVIPAALKKPGTRNRKPMIGIRI